MAKKNNKNKKYALGGEVFHIDSPAESIAKGNINFIKNWKRALDDTQYLQDIGDTMGIVGSILQSYGGEGFNLGKLFKGKNNNSASTVPQEFQTNGNTMVNLPSQNENDYTNMNYKDYSLNLLSNKFAMGGEVPIEAEGEEIVQEPDGQMYELDGASHEQGGIDMNVPEGTQIYSKRLKGVDGKSMADRKAFREKHLAKLQKLSELNPNDKILKRTLEKTQKDFAKQDADDLEYMNYMHNQNTQMFGDGGTAGKNRNPYLTDEQIAKGYKQAFIYKNKNNPINYDNEGYPIDFKYVGNGTYSKVYKPFNEYEKQARDEYLKKTYPNVKNPKLSEYGYSQIGKMGKELYDKARSPKTQLPPSILSNTADSITTKNSLFNELIDYNNNLYNNNTNQQNNDIVNSIVNTTPVQSNNNVVTTKPQQVQQTAKKTVVPNNTKKVIAPANNNVSAKNNRVVTPTPNNTATNNIPTNNVSDEDLKAAGIQPASKPLTREEAEAKFQELENRNAQLDGKTQPQPTQAGSTNLVTNNNSNNNPTDLSNGGRSSWFNDIDLDLPVTMGDVMGIYGKYKTATDPEKMTLLNRANDTANINAYENYGKRGINQLEQTKDFLANNLAQAIQNNTVNANTSRTSNNSNARSINTMRAMNLATDAQQMAADNQAYQQYANQIAGIDTQLANMMNQQDQMVMQGEQNRDDADRRDKDNFNMQLQRDRNTYNRGIQEIAKDINDIAERESTLNALNERAEDFKVSKNGTIRAKGDSSSWDTEKRYWNGKRASDYNKYLQKKSEGYFIDEATNAMYNKDGQEVDSNYKVIPNGRTVDVDGKKQKERTAEDEMISKVSKQLNGQTDFDNLSRDEKMKVIKSLTNGEMFYKGGIYWKALGKAAGSEDYRNYINPITGKRFTNKETFESYLKSNDNSTKGLDTFAAGDKYSNYAPLNSYGGLSQISGYFGAKNSKGKDIKSTMDINIERVNKNLDALSEEFDSSTGEKLDINNLNDATLNFFSKLGLIKYGYDAKRVMNGGKVKGLTKEKLKEEFKNTILMYLNR